MTTSALKIWRSDSDKLSEILSNFLLVRKKLRVLLFYQHSLSSIEHCPPLVATYYFYDILL